MANTRCVRCGKWKTSKEITIKSHEWCYSLLELEEIKLNTKKNYFLCNKCWLHLCNKKKSKNIKTNNKRTNKVVKTNPSIDTNSLTMENICFAGSGHKKCIICLSEVYAGSVVMPTRERLDMLIRHQLYASHGVRIWKDYLWNDYLLPDSKINRKNRETSIANLESSIILQLFNDLLSLIQEASSAPRLDFTDPSLTNEDYLTWNRWNQEQFENMFNLVSQHIRTTCNREARNALAMFWIKLKANLSFRQIGSLFNIPGDEENRRKLAARSFDSVRQVLLNKLVPKYLGISHLSRSEAIQHNTSFSNEFFAKNVTVIWEGTYFYTGIASSHDFQQSTYSGQKKRHLVKFMSLCLPDGYCLDTLGPFYGTANDASITNHILKTKAILAEWCDYGNLMIVDRGFRDVIEVFSDLGYEPKMPVY